MPSMRWRTRGRGPSSVLLSASQSRTNGRWVARISPGLGLRFTHASSHILPQHTIASPFAFWLATASEASVIVTLAGARGERGQSMAYRSMLIHIYTLVHPPHPIASHPIPLICAPPPSHPIASSHAVHLRIEILHRRHKRHPYIPVSHVPPPPHRS